MRLTLLAATTLAFAACTTASTPSGGPGAFSREPGAHEAEFRELYKELIETNTTLSVGSCTLASERMKARLIAAGYPESDLHILVNPAPNRPQDGNLIAILPGSDPNAKAIMLMAHIDVVEAKREN
jgi:acetylornithine deacetylase/succinyl-diaminopimelate desuccinylase-like protein